MEPRQSDGPPPSEITFDRAALTWLYGFVRPHTRRLTAVLLLSIVATAIALVQPYLTKLLIDDGLLPGQLDLVAGLCGLMLAAAVLGGLLGAFNRWLYVTASGRILFAMRESVFRHLLSLHPGFFARSRSGDLMSRLDGDIAEIQRFSVDALLALINGVLALAGSLALMIALSWELSLLAFVLLPAKYLFLRKVRPRVERLTRALRERVAEITSFFFDTLPAAKFIQSVAAEDRETERLAGLNRRYLGDVLRLQMTNYYAAAIPNLMTLAGTALVFLAGGYMMVQGALTLGTLIAFTAYMARATGPVQTLLGLYLGVRRAKVSLQRVMELTAHPPAVRPPEKPVALPADAGGEIRIEGVTFRHEEMADDVFSGAGLVIHAGSKVGLFGVSGVGKSTLIDLLHRHYDPHRGRILLDGVDLRDLDLAELRSRIAVVAQDIVLFAVSIADNIRYAVPHATEEQVREVAALAQIDEFIRSLPQGYDTPVGERGTTLSAGQRQRLAIARALLQDPLVLVLDEATSAVDQAAETRIMAEVDRLFAGRTRLVITHRHESLRGASMIVELAGGQFYDRKTRIASGG